MLLQKTDIKKNDLNQRHSQNASEQGSIFIVDDNEDDIFLLGREIKALFGDATMKVFKDGFALIKYMQEISHPDFLQRKKPRLILLDLYMPGMDGLLALKELRQDLHVTDVPVIILSNAMDQDEVDKAYELGANAFLSKPFSRLEFIQAIHHDPSLTHVN